jgi:hypothetical protein
MLLLPLLLLLKLLPLFFQTLNGNQIPMKDLNICMSENLKVHLCDNYQENEIIPPGLVSRV